MCPQLGDFSTVQNELLIFALEKPHLPSKSHLTSNCPGDAYSSNPQLQMTLGLKQPDTQFTRTDPIMKL